MRRILVICSLLIGFLCMRAQPYGNEWIDYTQLHYKIKVTKDGIYRVPYSTLSAIVPNLGAINKANFAMYHNGEAVALYISSTGNTMVSGDYIEFYGRKNTGDMDSLLYRSAALQAHQGYSLFTDTAIYFLTIRTTLNNPRILPVANNLTNPPAAEPYFMQAVTQYYNNRYYEGQYYDASGEEVYKSSFEEGEGYVYSSFFGTTASSSPLQVTQLSFNLPTPYINYSGPAATYNTVYINNSNLPDRHKVVIDLNGSAVYTTPAPTVGFKMNRLQLTIPLSSLQNTGNNVVTFSDAGSAVSNKQNAVAMNEIVYPRNFNFDGQNVFYFQLAADAVNKKYIEITNFNANGLQPVLYDLTNHILIRSTQPAGSSPLKFVLPPSALKRELYLISGDASTINTVTQVTATQFVDYTLVNAPQQQGEYLIITNSRLRDDGSGTDWVEEYRKYRDMEASPLTGTYHARVFDIEQLYDQYGYGIRKSPLAIRNFIRYTTAYWSRRPTHVFLVGKGREYNATRNNNSSAYNQCLVPTFGFPGSDNLYPASRTDDSPVLGIGRLSAENGTQVKVYLDKIKEYEEEQRTYSNDQPIGPKIWQKQILHFSGGTGASEQITFKSYLNNYANIAKDTSWGATTTAYSREGSDPIDQSQAQIIRNQINNGVSLITFFGHSATGAFDFSIDEPQNYTNAGKYPVILSNGCFAGYVYDVSPGYSEKFVFQPSAGSIAFMATTSLSLPTGLNTFSRNFYQHLCRNHYNNTLGTIIQQTLDTIYSANPDKFDLLVAYEMTLHGDPGIKFNQYPRPDYAIDASSVSFNPSTVDAGTDSFEVNILVTNLGKAIKDSINVTLTRLVYDASNNLVPLVYTKRVKAPYYRDNVAFKLPTRVNGLGYGQNVFDVYVESDRVINEMAEDNNYIIHPNSVSISIQSDDVIPVYPYEFAIVPDTAVTLKASTVNPFAAARNYKFQLDTTELFNSPVLQTGIVYQAGGVLHWKRTLDYRMDSTVYYWRVAIDSSAPNWHNSSFIYIKGEDPGWNQSHYYQWKKDDSTTLHLDADRIWRYSGNVNNIKVVTGLATTQPGGTVPFSSLGWDYNNNNEYRYRMGSCGFTRGITFAVIDSISGVPWVSHNNNQDGFGDQFGNYHCNLPTAVDQFGFDFAGTGTHPTLGIPWSQVIANFINAIPAGNYILIYSTNAPAYTSWDNTLVTALQSINFPAQAYQTGAVTGPFVYFVKKNSSTFIPFYASRPDYSTAIDTSINFTGPWYKGEWISPKIGPAEQWISMHWRTAAAETPTADKDSIDMIGVTYSGTETLLFTTTNFDNYTLANTINAAQYPYVRLRLRTADDSLRTPTQMRYWRVLYKKAPEAAMNPAAHFVLTDSVALGGHLHLELGLENITELPMDSMLTRYTLRDAQLGTGSRYVRFDTLGGLQLMVLVYDSVIQSQNFVGLNKLIIEANPDNDQLEQYHFNNFAEIDFSTSGDKINPLLDVTFDGQHIFNGDIVSAKPNVLITLRDENRFLALNDTSALDVYIKYPNETTPRRMNYDNVTMKFYPADSGNVGHINRAQVDLKPEFTVDGTYELMVKDRDRSGNHSSNQDRYENNTFYDYKTTFEVVNKPMVSNVLNYPNPFTTATRFLFTITGSQVPDYMKIQIMTIKGTVVKEITMEEMGPLHIGRNMTEYRWDGRDQYGDLLANGVYFYRVVTRLDDKQMDHMGASYDKYFKKGFGKLVIIR